MEHSYTNKLINETSPYLLQHAHNPVNWFPWGDEALLIAKKENKPILVSIGYAACHWCHVMERESFEDEATAKIMNESFINIKIDREERPDLDHIYMDAVQAMTGSGGWPLNVFLTPEAKPFFGGTYFPPQKAYNRPSWQETLLGVKQAFQQRRHEMDAQAENLTQHLLQSNSFGNQKIAGAEIISAEKTVTAFNNIMKTADKDWGGFGKAPKFPQAFVIQFLLRFGHIQKQASGQESLQTPSRPDISKSDESKQRSEEAITQALLSLDKMIEGGIYDQIGGGFSRYSTDTEWLVPHFEKMLYDNALLLSVLSEAYQLTKADRYKEVIEETMNFIQRELVHPQKGFYASLDADSEGVEGKFYVWDIKEIKELLGEDADLFCRYYAITEKGNWEEKNILQVLNPLENFAIENKIAVTELKKLLEKGKKILLEKRNTRIRPLLDDKIILGWNALMNSACSKAFGATGNEAWKQLAIQNMEFILQHFVTDKADAFYHTWKNGTAKYPAFLDDYAYLIQALLNLQEITGETKWLKKAKSITSYVIENFSEPETGYFFYTSIQQRDVIVRKKEVYDGAVPSGNSIMAYNLHHLSILFDKKEWEERSLAMIMGLGKAIITYPTSFGNWACLLLEMITGTNEIVIMGSDNSGLQAEIHQQYIPHRIIMSSVTANPDFPLLAEKDPGKTPSIFLCRNYTCKLPVFSVKDLISLINKPQTG
ncbi:MAG: thioredoxin domain-containing protein [Chitinophagaceae bacterium]|nr:thioredoxin domain-containing protein [Chitinophagaceae bacterium]